jgi:hypothetical protein
MNRNVEKVWGARYLLKNTVDAIGMFAVKRNEMNPI